MSRKKNSKSSEKVNCKEIFFNEWNSYIMECKALTAGSSRYADIELVQQLTETKYKMEAFAQSSDTKECKEGSMDELLCILEKLKIVEVDQLLRGFNMHLKILTSLRDNETDPSDRALMENTLYDAGIIFTELCRYFNVRLENL